MEEKDLLLYHGILKIRKCIHHFIGIDVSGIPIKYVGMIEFYHCIKLNYSLDMECFSTEQIKQRYTYLCEIVKGLYKWKEKTIYIKQQYKYDFSILLAELLHSMSMTQGHNEVQPWISEGLPHFLAKVLCRRCGIACHPSGYVEYISFWEKVTRRYGFDCLKSILYKGTLKELRSKLRSILSLDELSILELPFQTIEKRLSDE